MGSVSNLPPRKSGTTCSAQTSQVIDAPIERIWNALLDFPSYSKWNPYVTEQVVVDSKGRPKPDQTASVGQLLRFTVNMPTKHTNEILTALDPATHRVAWVFNERFVPRWFLFAERWQALSTIEENGQMKVLYETREEFSGLLAIFIKWSVLSQVQKGFEDTAAALKRYTEG